MASPARDARLAAQARGFTEIVERGRGYLRMRNPTTGQFAIDTQAGGMGWHYGPSNDQEVDTAWVVSSGQWDYEVIANDFHSFVRANVPISYRYVDPATGHFVEITYNAIQWINDAGQTANAASFGQVTPILADNTIRWDGIAPGWGVQVVAGAGQLAKWLTIDSLSALGAPSIGGTNIKLRFRLTFQRSNGLDVYVNNVRWSGGNNTFLETTGPIEFRDVFTGLPVFWFAPPAGTDADGNLPPMIQRVRRTGVNIYSEIDTPWTWLQSAIYPVELDDTIEPQTGASSEDGIEIVGSSPTLTDTSIPFGTNNSTGAIVGARFTGITIPAGATIDVAYLMGYFYSGTSDDVSCTLYAHDDAAPDTFTTDNGNIDGRTLTTASVSWISADVLGGGGAAWINSSSIVSIIDELMASYTSYSSGSIAILGVIATSQAEKGSARTWDQTGNVLGPKLHIEFTPETAATLIVADIAHAHALEAVALSQIHALSLADIAHAHALEVLNLSGVIVLVVANIAHAQALEAAGALITGIRYVDGYGGDINTAEDTFVHSTAPTINFGLHNVLDITAIRNALLRFNLSAIPAGSTCTAQLHFYHASSGGSASVTGTIYAIAIGNTDWQPGGEYGGEGGAGDPCWNYKDQDPGNETPWAGSAGLSTSGQDYEADAIGTWTGNSNDPIGTEYVITLDADRIAGWFGATNTNHGILVKANGNLGYVGSAENATTAYRPKLVVYYVAPVSLSPADIAHDHSLEVVALSQTHNLALTDIVHAHSLDALSLSGATLLTLADIAHGHVLDALVLGQIHILIVADIAHAHSLDSLALTQDHNLALADIAHANALDAVVLTVIAAGTLNVQDIAHAHALDAVALSQTHNLALADIAHAHALEAVILARIYNLVLADIAHAHSLEALVIVTGLQLVIADIAHSHSLDSLALTQDHNLALADIAHAHSLDALVLQLIGPETLTVQDIAHAHGLDAITLVDLIVLAARIYAIAAEDRAWAVAGDDRTYGVPQP